ncbi:MAG: phage virion morphogenesis protein [Gammaproteobacteria bacterium]|nr:phage virion morphogenesis protein [Gammaproteobacteria bacterium]
MAGALIELDLSGLAAAEAVLVEYQRLIASPGVLLDDIGQHLVNTTDERFDRRESPAGQPWDAVSPAYAKRKAAGRATKRSGAVTDPALRLELTRDLRRGIRHQVNGTDLLVGTDREYGATHQFGRGGIPARPFLGVSAEDEREIALILRHYLKV